VQQMQVSNSAIAFPYSFLMVVYLFVLVCIANIVCLKNIYKLFCDLNSKK
jgi:hypothetical protein